MSSPRFLGCLFFAMDTNVHAPILKIAAARAEINNVAGNPETGGPAFPRKTIGFVVSYHNGAACRCVVVNLCKGLQAKTSGTRTPSSHTGSSAGSKPCAQNAPQRAPCGIVGPVRQLGVPPLAIRAAAGAIHDRLGWHKNEPDMVPLWHVSCCDTTGPKP